MRTPSVVLLVPCYNTSWRCADVIARAAPFVDAILAVDDGSTDDTAAHLAATGCRVLHLPANRGKGAALGAGFRELLGDTPGFALEYVLTMDGDGQHEPADIPRFLAEAERSGADLVLGTRRPLAMPVKNRIGAHFSRLLFLTVTGSFVADTQSGFRLLSVRLVRELIDRVTWKGYESESEVLWRTLALKRSISAVEIRTIYFEGNRGSHFHPWRDSARIAALFTPQLLWTVSMAMLDLAIFALLTGAGLLSPVWANILARAAAVLCQAALRDDYLGRARRLVEREGAASCLLVFGGHLTMTTMLVATFVALGAHPVAAKAVAQLLGYLGSFAALDQILLARVFRTRRWRGAPAAQPPD
jgi:glycosyltransferase involved in cell wall biosynthesis